MPLFEYVLYMCVRASVCAACVHACMGARCRVRDAMCTCMHAWMQAALQRTLRVLHPLDAAQLLFKQPGVDCAVVPTAVLRKHSRGGADLRGPASRRASGRAHVTQARTRGWQRALHAGTRAAGEQPAGSPCIDTASRVARPASCPCLYHVLLQQAQRTVIMRISLPGPIPLLWGGAPP